MRQHMIVNCNVAFASINKGLASPIRQVRKSLMGTFSFLLVQWLYLVQLYLL